MSNSLTINRYFKKEAMVSKEEYDRYKEVLKNYEEQVSQDYEEVEYDIEEASSNKKKYYDKQFEAIDNAIKGKYFEDQTVEDNFVADTGSNDAFNIMNEKASIFDVNNLNVELKSTTLNPNDKGRDEAFVDTFNRILNETYLEKSTFKHSISDAIKYSRGYPLAITQIGYDDNMVLGPNTNFSGDITCSNVPLNEFFWDPATNNIDDCEYVYVAKTLPLRTIYNHLKQLSKRDIETLEAFYVLENQKIKPITEGVSSFVKNSVLIEKGSIELITLYKKKRISNTKTEIKLYYVVGKKYVVGEQTYNIPYLPFTTLKEYDAPNSFTGVSTIQIALPYLRSLCLLDTAINDMILMNKSPVYLIDSSSGLEGDELINWTYNGQGKSFTVNGAPSNSAYLLPTPQLTNDMLIRRSQLEESISKIANSVDVNNFGSKLSGSAVNSVVSQAAIKENTSVVELERYLVRFVRIMMSFIATKLKDKKQEELTFRAQKHISDKSSGEYEMISITPDEFEHLEADIIIDASLLRATKKEAQIESLLNIYQMGLQYEGEAIGVQLNDIAELLNLPNKHKIVKRLEDNTTNKQIQQATALVQQANEIVQNPEAVQALQGMLGKDNITPADVVPYLVQNMKKEGK